MCVCVPTLGSPHPVQPHGGLCSRSAGWECALGEGEGQDRLWQVVDGVRVEGEARHLHKGQVCCDWDGGEHQVGVGTGTAEVGPGAELGWVESSWVKVKAG